ncbi:hemerythrin domain-containing protein [Pelagibius sp.]|uniref:hemerythrin domain-containing protein n=1 Tax=Pelagibius sp. TaxID=1931238 RepID=UPI0026218582|nr:hemerythrin domain-containing protein [Pelagibius sp.]
MRPAIAKRPRLEAMPASLLAKPLDYIFADHFRQRTLCNLLEELADATALDEALAREVVAFLVGDMAVHVLDEEDDLFPLLRRRCPPEDEIEAVLGALAREHEADERMAGNIVEGLQACVATGNAPRADPDLRARLTEFARRQRRHLAVENSIVLPIARQRLTELDLANLTKRMTERRA